MNFFRKYSRKSAAAKAAVLLTAVCGCIFSACGTNSSDHYTGNPEQTDDGSDRKSGSDVPDISSDSNSDELVSLIQHTVCSAVSAVRMRGSIISLKSRPNFLTAAMLLI